MAPRAVHRTALVLLPWLACLLPACSLQTAPPNPPVTLPPPATRFAGVPSPTPLPTFTATPPPPTALPALSIPTLLAEFDGLVQLNQSFIGAGPLPEGMLLPPASEWELRLLPRKPQLYVAQRLLEQEYLLRNPAATAKLYLVYDYERGQKLWSVLAWGVYAELTVGQGLLAEIGGQKYFLEHKALTAGEGLSSQKEMVEVAVAPLEKLGEQAALAEGVVERVVGAACGMDQPGYDAGRRLAWLRYALGSPNLPDQFMALSELRHFAPELVLPALPEILPFLASEKTDMVRVAAELLAHLGPLAKEATPALIPLLGSEHSDVQQAALRALEAISGQALGEDPAAWEQWWKENK